MVRLFGRFVREDQATSAIVVVLRAIAARRAASEGCAQYRPKCGMRQCMAYDE